ncbi:winged helix-turn-helix transcriptional regulator [Terriglobus tenax]|uniref:winged helix-turn-helix transcriptional regulator n=1 Tax=Terriglobus tenax TaxID=1111115 RepID=UPI0021E03F90|nr:helix-turn-helix domain-containing protein [Terriglobus tenax]
MVTAKKLPQALEDECCPQRPYDIYASDCPTRQVLDRIADKWALLILDCLRDGPVRFNQLRRELMGVSQKVLAETLRKLERDGLLVRTVYPTVPVSVEYTLTPLGTDLSRPVAQLAHWAETHMPSVLKAQQAYDATEKQRKLATPAVLNRGRG